MFCRKCGKQVPDQAKFCKFCGASLERKKKVQQGEDLSDQTIIPDSSLIVKPAKQASNEAKSMHVSPKTAVEDKPKTIVDMPVQSVPFTGYEPPKDGKEKYPVMIAVVTALIVLVVGGSGIGAMVVFGIGPFAQFKKAQTVDMDIKDTSDYKEDNVSDEEKWQVDESVFHEADEDTKEETEPAEENEEYLITDSQSRELTEADLMNMEAKELTYARNEIYARHGAIFKADELNAFFGAKEWYQQIPDKKPVADISLSATEIANADLILQYQKDHDLNYTPE